MTWRGESLRFTWREKRVRLNLGLQGGGAHGAFTWGVLDRLLDETDIDFGWVSATSAGAVNGVALVSGLASGGRAGARDVLRAVWEGVIEAGVPDLMRLNPFLFGMSRSPSISQVATLFSPYEFNPLGFDPLRKLLSRHIDFEQLRGFGDMELLVAATDVATGRLRLFRRRELTVEAVLASTCLPTLHHAVEIEGRAYWDGGFSANPDLVTLAAESPIGDTLIVQLNAVERAAPPRTAREISFEVSRVTFNQPFIRDVAQIVGCIRHARRGWLGRRERGNRIARHRFHLIEAGRHTAALSPETKLRTERSLLVSLYNAGREETGHWLSQCRGQVGRRGTVDLAAKFLAPLGPLQAASPVAPAIEDADEALLGAKL